MEINFPFILEAITSVGFPIFCVVVLFVFVYLLWKQSVERENLLLTELSRSHEINAQFTDIIAQYNSELSEIKSDVKDIKSVLKKEDTQ